MSILISLLIGALSGWLASLLMKSNSNILKNVVLGIAGGFVGTLLFDIFKISFAGYLGTIFVSGAGACLVIFLCHKLLK